MHSMPKTCQQAGSAGQCLEKLGRKEGGEGMWHSQYGGGFHSTGSTAKLVFWSVSERKQEANSAGGTVFRMSSSFAFH